MSIIGFDSRHFTRTAIKRDGTTGHFESEIGIGIRISDYEKFKTNYLESMKKSFEFVGLQPDYSVYCTHDLISIEKHDEIIADFFKKIAKNVERVHVFYTLFSPERNPEVKAFGRFAQKNKLKLSKPTMSYADFMSKHLMQCFPGICAWRIMRYFGTEDTQFHFDSYEGHIFEAQEELEKSDFKRYVYPNGDCLNPIISTADLLLHLLDKRLTDSKQYLLFENIRPLLQEFGSKVLVYPITNKYLQKITPLDKVSINLRAHLKHPVFWVFKNDRLIDATTMKTSKAYRNLMDFAASKYGCVKSFDTSSDIDYFQPGDYGVYFNEAGEETIHTYRKMGIIFRPLNIDTLVPTEFRDDNEKLK